MKLKIPDSNFKTEILPLILTGTSVIDWRGLSFKDRDEINQFLRLCQFDPESASDQDWMRSIIQNAVSYFEDHFRYKVPREISSPKAVQDLLGFASGLSQPRLRKIACIILKICHVIHHIEGRDLFHRLPLAEEAFGQMAEKRVNETLKQMIASGLPIRKAYSSTKSRTSLISKLLQKAETLAAEIYDRTRFRIIVDQRENIPQVLQELTERLFPFHLIVPGQTHNSLIENPGHSTTSQRNTFSGSSYKMLKFVVDMPIRIDDQFISTEIANATQTRIVHSLVEFQILDQATSTLNDQGDNDHRRYKKRQNLHIIRRLTHGDIPWGGAK